MLGLKKCIIGLINTQSRGKEILYLEGNILNEDIFNKFPVLEVDDITLRKLNASDSEYMLEYTSDKDVLRYLPEGALYNNKDEIYDLIKRVNQGFQDKEKIRWGIVFNDGNKVIGDIGYNSIDRENNIGKISYRLSKKYWGKGIITKVLNRIIDYSFNKMKLNRIEALTIDNNVASIKVLEKTGFKKEGLLRKALNKRGSYYDLAIYSLLKDEAL